MPVLIHSNTKLNEYYWLQILNTDLNGIYSFFSQYIDLLWLLYAIIL